jgi:xanthine dehydrogenase YagS FAD-binding subunit
VAAALLALDARLHTSRRELPLAELYRLPTDDDRRTTTLEPGELILEVSYDAPAASVYLKAMERKRWAFPLVGVAAVRRDTTTRVALAGVAPVPWLLDGFESATPLPRNAYKLDVAKALVKRATAAVEG